MGNRADDSTQSGERTQLYSEAPGAAGATGKQDELRASLVVIAGEEIGREIELADIETVIGRGEDAQARVYARSVSRSHARIVRSSAPTGERFTILDMGSMNGTLLNNMRVEESVLHNGDKIQLGDVVFKFLVQDALEQQYHRQIHRLIHFDQLTGLMTMESFRKVLDDYIDRARHGTVFTLAMTDLDGLKRVNDSLGHLAGRKTVAAMGAIMREVLRPIDRAGLYGGDEGIVLFPGAALEDAHLLAERLREAIEERGLEHDGQRFSVTISQGLAEWPAHGRSAEELIAAADAALYTAKAEGRNRVCLAPPPGATMAASRSGD